MQVGCRHLVVSSLFLVAGAASALAFWPTNLRTNIAPGTVSHERVTHDVLEQLDREFFGVERPTRSMRRAIEQVAFANEQVDADNFDAAQEWVIGQRDRVVEALAAGDDVTARFALGSALHAIQDFYSHTDWIELGHRDANPQLGRRGRAGHRFQPITPVPPADAPTCRPCTDFTPLELNCRIEVILDEILAKGQIVSGYYGGEDVARPVLPGPNKKCTHGGPFDGGAGGPMEGINKDSVSPSFSQHNYLHKAAIAGARLGTEQFVRDIKAEISPGALRLLLGAGSTLVFAFDTTGSMGTVLDKATAQARTIVNEHRSGPDAPRKYVLVPFNDPAIGPVLTTPDPDAFLAAIEAIDPYGGGDCPEPSMAATLKALSVSDEDGFVFTFTDASASDNHLGGDVARASMLAGVQVRYMTFGSCSPTDPAYFEVARRSGGQVFELKPDEAGDATRLVGYLVRPDAVTVLAVTDVVSGPRTIDFPVDDTLRNLTVSVAGTAAAQLRQPSGDLVSAGPGREVVTLSDARLFAIDTPAPGTWHVELNGGGDVSVQVTGESPLDLVAFRFVEPGGRPGHEGFFPLAGLPPIGTATMVTAALSTPVTAATFELRDPSGALLQTLALTTGEGQEAGEFSGQVVPPAGEFLATVSGVDTAGRAFRRVLPRAPNAQPVTVEAPAPAPVLVAGGSEAYTFTVRNHGAADTFDFSAVDDRGFVEDVAPARATLAAGADRTVTLTLAAPAEARVPSLDTVSLSAVSTTQSDVANLALVRVDVDREDDADPCTVDACTPLLGCMHRPLAGVPLLDCELQKLLAPSGCDPLDKVLKRILRKKVKAARRLAAKLERETRAKRIRRLGRKIDRQLNVIAKRAARRAKRHKVSVACRDTVAALVAERREIAADLVSSGGGVTTTTVVSASSTTTSSSSIPVTTTVTSSTTSTTFEIIIEF
jgi:hypothetical protein